MYFLFSEISEDLPQFFIGCVISDYTGGGKEGKERDIQYICVCST